MPRVRGLRKSSSLDRDAVFAALPRVRPRSGALRPAGRTHQINNSCCFVRAGTTVIAERSEDRSSPAAPRRRSFRCARNDGPPRVRRANHEQEMAESEFTNVRGTVKFFNAAKGYGFLVREDGGQDVFVHITDLRPSLQLLGGQVVTFDVETTHRGLRAVNVAMASE
jgi:cold shock protein